MLIHRIAHPLVVDQSTGRAVGPYNAGRIARANDLAADFAELMVEVSEIVEEHNDFSHAPVPTFEGQYIREGREQSVFTTQEQAESWFRAGVGVMREAGFRWFTYEIAEKHVRTTRTQAIANLRRARLVSINDIPLPDGPAVEKKCFWCWMPKSECYCEVNDTTSSDDGITDCVQCGYQPWSCTC
jgi:hypothetical protein